MATLCNFISTTLTMLLLTQCNTKQDINSTPHAFPSTVKTQLSDRLISEWKYDNTIWYTSELTLQGNGVFKFHDQGCYGQNFTEGYWTNNKGKIILSSYESYRPIEEENTIIKSSNEKPEKKRN